MLAPQVVKSYLPALIPLVPLLGAIFSYIVGRKAGKGAGALATLAAMLSFALTVMGVVDLGPAEIKEARLWEWFSVTTSSLDSALRLSFDLTLRLDRLSAVMCLVITGIGSLIHIYSTAYMEHDEGVARFFCYLNLFLFSMLTLVLGGNLLVLFIGWEGVGLCSYLLIGFWYKNLDYCAAGRKAFVVNRIGDAAVLIAVFLLITNFKTLDFLALRGLLTDVSPANQLLNSATGNYTLLCSLIGLCLFIGATGKSAQLPLFVWLPDAMAGPTPVSALIHAATMVTAGIYLFARMWFLFDAAGAELGLIVVIVASFTAFISATIALTQNDIKKVLAYSTVSQLGFMFLAAGAQAYWVALFHVITHAFFKACLFLGAGSVIHGCHHEQDMGQMGGLRRLMPVTFITYLVSTIAIAGIYPFAGYYSKHAIFDSLAHSNNSLVQATSSIILILASFTAALTAFYMTRSLVLTFFGEYRGHAHPHESPVRMTVPLIILACLALAGGIALEHSLPHYLSEVLPRTSGHDSLGALAALKASWLGLLGVVAAAIIYGRFKRIAERCARGVPVLYRFLSGRYFIDEIYRAVIVRPLELLSSFLWKGIDQGVIDGAVNATGEVVDLTGEVARNTQTGDVRHYATFIFSAALVMIALYMVL